MVQNKTHVCGCCGKKGHTMQTCPLPGAKKIRALSAQLLQAKAQRKKVRANQPKVRRGGKAFKKLAAKRSSMYTGKRPKDNLKMKRRARENKTQGRGGQGQEEALKDLLDAGYLTKPPLRCPACRRGALGAATTFQHPDIEKTHLYYRCNEDKCQRRFNVTSFTKLPLAGLVCTQIRGAIEQYTDAAGSSAPSAAQAAKTSYAGLKTMAKLFAHLRAKEASLAHEENKVMKLGGKVQGLKNIEGDGTLVRKMRVSLKNEFFGPKIQKTVEAMKRLHMKKSIKTKGKNMKSTRFVAPKHWCIHIRYAALCERAGRISVINLPEKVVAPATPPPPEAFEEMKTAGLLNRIDKKAFLFCDGAHAWKLLVNEHNKTHGARVRLTNVSHYKGEYTKTVLNRARGQAALAGTQSIDSRWRWLKKYVPHSVKARAPKGCPNPVNPLLDEYVYSWQWRTNCKAAGKSLWLQLGEEVFKA